MKQRNIIREILFFAIVIAVIVTALSFIFTRNNVKKEITYNDILVYFHNEQVREVRISAKNVVTLKIENADGKTEEISYRLRDYAQFYEDLGDVIHEQVLAGTITVYEPERQSDVSFIWNYLPMLFLLPGTLFPPLAL